MKIKTLNESSDNNFDWPKKFGKWTLDFGGGKNAIYKYIYDNRNHDYLCVNFIPHENSRFEVIVDLGDSTIYQRDIEMDISSAESFFSVMSEILFWIPDNISELMSSLTSMSNSASSVLYMILYGKASVGKKLAKARQNIDRTIDKAVSGNRIRTFHKF